MVNKKCAKAFQFVNILKITLTKYFCTIFFKKKFGPFFTGPEFIVYKNFPTLQHAVHNKRLNKRVEFLD